MDKIIQIGLRRAYAVLRGYWFLARPETVGVYVAVWNKEELLLIKNPYKNYYRLPGGGIAKNESLAEAAARELREEVGIKCTPTSLERGPAITSKHEWVQYKIVASPCGDILVF